MVHSSWIKSCLCSSVCISLLVWHMRRYENPNLRIHRFLMMKIGKRIPFLMPSIISIRLKFGHIVQTGRVWKQKNAIQVCGCHENRHIYGFEISLTHVLNVILHLWFCCFHAEDPGEFCQKCNILVLLLLFVSHSKKNESDYLSPCYVRQIARVKTRVLLAMWEK